MKKVLLIAFYFNQTNEIASKRLRGLGKYLPKYGWEPVILVPNLGENNENKNDINCKIIETPYEDMIEKWMSKKNKKNETNNIKPIKDSKDTNNKALSKLISIAGEIFAYPDGMKYWYKPAITESSKIIEEENINAIISSSFPITSHLIGKELKNKYNIPWIADLRDLWNTNPYINHTHIRNFFEMRLEKNTLSQANALTTTSQLAAEQLQKLHPTQEIKAILNGYDPEEIKLIKNNPQKNNKLNLTYAGSLYSGKRNPEILFKAISDLIKEGKIQKDKIELNFYGDNSNLEILKNKYQLTDNVKINGFIPHEEVLKKQNQSDILLLISWNNPKEKIFIPGKVYEYIGLQHPVLSIGYKEGSLKDLINDTNIGKHTTDIETLKKALIDYYNEFDKTGQIKFEPKENINKYSIENMALEFSKLLNKM